VLVPFGCLTLQLCVGIRLSIDGVQITDDERANALVFVLNEEKKFGAFLKRGGWPEHKEAAIDLFSRAPTSESDPVSPTKQDVLLPTVYTTAAFTRTPKSTAQEDGNDQEKGDAKLSAARGPHDTSLAAQAQVSRVDQAIEASGAAMAGKVTGTGMGAAGTLFDVGVTAATGFLAGSLLTKAEIAINFFQVYGLVLSLPITFEWPWLWKAVSDVYVGWLRRGCRARVSLGDLTSRTHRSQIPLVRWGAVCGYRFADEQAERHCSRFAQETLVLPRHDAVDGGTSHSLFVCVAHGEEVVDSEVLPPLVCQSSQCSLVVGGNDACGGCTWCGLRLVRIRGRTVGTLTWPCFSSWLSPDVFCWRIFYSQHSLDDHRVTSSSASLLCVQLCSPLRFFLG